jgi:RNA polymerase sigma-B factor
MISSHAATMRRREERRLLLYHGAGEAGAREELAHRFLPLARQLARELKRYFRDHGWAVRVPRSVQERIVRVEEATEALWREQDRPPTPAELAERTQNTVEQVLEARQAAGARWAISLDPSGDEEDAGAPADSLAVDDPGFLLAEDAATTERLMLVLPDREREILRLRFREDLYQSEVAERVGVSTTHVARVLRRSLEALHETATRHSTSRVVATRTASDT